VPGSPLIDNVLLVPVMGALAHRFLATASEAGPFVMQAASLGRPGEVSVLDVRDPASILKIAEKMVSFSGTNIPISFTGLRKGEKFHDALTGEGVGPEPTNHPLICSQGSPKTNPGSLPQKRALLLQRDGSGSAGLGVRELVSQSERYSCLLFPRNHGGAA